MKRALPILLCLALALGLPAGTEALPSAAAAPLSPQPAAAGTVVVDGVDLLTQPLGLLAPSGGGLVRYDSASATLYLSGAAITQPGGPGGGAGIYSSLPGGLTVALGGRSTLSGPLAQGVLLPAGNLTITGPGSLSVACGGLGNRQGLSVPGGAAVIQGGARVSVSSGPASSPGGSGPVSAGVDCAGLRVDGASLSIVGGNIGARAALIDIRDGSLVRVSGAAYGGLTTSGSLSVSASAVEVDINGYGHALSAQGSLILDDAFVTARAVGSHAQSALHSRGPMILRGGASVRASAASRPALSAPSLTIASSHVDAFCAVDPAVEVSGSLTAADADLQAATSGREGALLVHGDLTLSGGQAVVSGQPDAIRAGGRIDVDGALTARGAVTSGQGAAAYGPASAQPPVFPGADYAALDRAVARAQALDPAAYEGFVSVEAALSAVARGLPATRQAEVDAMAAAIDRAAASLVPRAGAAPRTLDSFGGGGTSRAA